MKTFITLLMLAGMSVGLAQSTWKVDKSHSKIGFNITHLMISEVNGNFDDFDIEATAGDAFEEPNFTVEVRTTSIDTDHERRDNDLRSEGYFGVEEFPTMSFKTTAVEMTGEKTFKLTGDLTLKGVTQSITLDGKVNGVITNRRSQKLKAGLKLTGMINRLTFNVGKESVAVGNDVEIVINLEMNQQ